MAIKDNLYAGFWHRKCIEPIKRKHGRTEPEWQSHRFEIRNGISWRDALIHDFAQRNTLLDLVKVSDGH